MVYEKEKKLGWFFLKGALPYWSIALVMGLGGMLIIDILTPAEPLNFNWEGVMMFMAVAAGIGWMIHGTGFLLVKVN